jgi:hypothetical protein
MSTVQDLFKSSFEEFTTYYDLLTRYFQEYDNFVASILREQENGDVEVNHTEYLTPHHRRIKPMIRKLRTNLEESSKLFQSVSDNDMFKEGTGLTQPEFEQIKATGEENYAKYKEYFARYKKLIDYINYYAQNYTPPNPDQFVQQASTEPNSSVVDARELGGRNGDGNLTCAICFEEVQAGDVLSRVNCDFQIQNNAQNAQVYNPGRKGHVFHRRCIMRWKNTLTEFGYNNHCPLCRIPLLLNSDTGESYADKYEQAKITEIMQITMLNVPLHATGQAFGNRSNLKRVNLDIAYLLKIKC